MTARGKVIIVIVVYADEIKLKVIDRHAADKQSVFSEKIAISDRKREHDLALALRTSSDVGTRRIITVGIAHPIDLTKETVICHVVPNVLPRHVVGYA